jgi:4-diphosphocytidyl-2-C-methyl-D-erythritol kinase
VTAVTCFAAAKVNLYLHLLGRRADGYHLIDSLVAFADIGDRLTARPAGALSLEVTGAEAEALAGESDNLVLRAARVLAKHAGIAAAAALHLEKILPVAGGVGGGSADAAAALRALRRLWRIEIDDAGLAQLGERLGADIPVCVFGKPAWVAGIGEQIEFAPLLPSAGILLVNPRRRLPTATVFNARSGEFGGAAGRPSRSPSDPAALAAVLAPLRNDLTAAAISFFPEIGRILNTLGQLPGALIARMSGSGATCFALFRDRATARRAQLELTAAEPGWWCAAGNLMARGEAGAGDATSPTGGSKAL